MDLTYTVVLARDQEQGGYLVRVPALGCVTEGDDLSHAMRMAEEVIIAYLDGEQELGKPLPPDVDAFNLELGEAREALVLKVTVPFEEAALAA